MSRPGSGRMSINETVILTGRVEDLVLFPGGAWHLTVDTGAGSYPVVGDSAASLGPGVTNGGPVEVFGDYTCDPLGGVVVALIAASGDQRSVPHPPAIGSLAALVSPDALPGTSLEGVVEPLDADDSAMSLADAVGALA